MKATSAKVREGRRAVRDRCVPSVSKRPERGNRKKRSQNYIDFAHERYVQNTLVRKKRTTIHRIFIVDSFLRQRMFSSGRRGRTRCAGRGPRPTSARPAGPAPTYTATSNQLIRAHSRREKEKSIRTTRTSIDSAGMGIQESKMKAAKWRSPTSCYNPAWLLNPAYGTMGSA